MTIMQKLIAEALVVALSFTVTTTRATDLVALQLKAKEFAWKYRFEIGISASVAAAYGLGVLSTKLTPKKLDLQSLGGGPIHLPMSVDVQLPIVDTQNNHRAWAPKQVKYANKTARSLVGGKKGSFLIVENVNSTDATIVYPSIAEPLSGSMTSLLAASGSQSPA